VQQEFQDMNTSLNYEPMTTSLQDLENVVVTNQLTFSWRFSWLKHLSNLSPWKTCCFQWFLFIPVFSFVKK